MASRSRSDIANKLGVTPQYVSRILSGNTNFSFKSVAEIEKTRDFVHGGGNGLK
ncbi:MAG: helix-turn-helix transcriptional regulator [Prevotella sp.]|nr:helix-turn-helix transcriptional regulator [Prevotella sp.]